MLNSINVFAADRIDLSFSTDGNVKSGKVFNVYLNFTSDSGIGAVYAIVEYDSNLLDLKTASIENKQSGEYFKYDNSDGEVKMIYMTKGKVTEMAVKLRFVPLYYDEADYTLYADVSEAYTADESALQSSGAVAIHLREGVIQDSSEHSEIQELSKEQEDEVSAETSRKVPTKADESSKSLKDSVSDISDDVTAEVEVDTSESEHTIQTRNDNLQSGSVDYVSLIGACIVIAVGIIVSVKLRRKIK